MAGINEALAARALRLARENNPQASPRRVKYTASVIFGALASANLLTLGEFGRHVRHVEGPDPLRPPNGRD